MASAAPPGPVANAAAPAAPPEKRSLLDYFERGNIIDQSPRPQDLVHRARAYDKEYHRAIAATKKDLPKPVRPTEEELKDRPNNQPPPWLKYEKSQEDPLEGIGPSLGSVLKSPSPLWMALVDCIGPFSKSDQRRINVALGSMMVEPIALAVGGFLLAKHTWRFTALRIKPFVSQLLRKAPKSPEDALPISAFTPSSLLPRAVREVISERRLRRLRKRDLRRAIWEKARLETAETRVITVVSTTWMLGLMGASVKRFDAAKSKFRNLLARLSPLRMRFSSTEALRFVTLLGVAGYGAGTGFRSALDSLDFALDSMDDPYLRECLAILVDQGTNAQESVYFLTKFFAVADYTKKHGFYGSDDGGYAAMKNLRPKRQMDDNLLLQSLKKYNLDRIEMPGYIPSDADMSLVQAQLEDELKKPYYVPGRLQEWREHSVGDPFEDWYIASRKPYRTPDRSAMQPVTVERGFPEKNNRLIRQFYKQYGDEELGFSLDPHQLKHYDIHGPMGPAIMHFRQDDRAVEEQERYVQIRKRQAIREWHGDWASAEEREIKKTLPAVDPEFNYRAATMQLPDEMMPLSVYEKEKLDDWKDWSTKSDLVLYDTRIDGKITAPKPRWDVILQGSALTPEEYVAQQGPRYKENVDLDFLWKGQEAAHPTPPLTRYSVNMWEKWREDSPEGAAMREQMRARRDPGEFAPRELREYPLEKDPRLGGNFVPHIEATTEDGVPSREDIERGYLGRPAPRPQGLI